MYTHCKYCKCELAKNYDPRHRPNNAPTYQHILPRRRGGSDKLENLRPCCTNCNGLLEAADDCPAALQCGIAIADRFIHTTDVLLRSILLKFPRSSYIPPIPREKQNRGKYKGIRPKKLKRT